MSTTAEVLIVVTVVARILVWAYLSGKSER